MKRPIIHFPAVHIYNLCEFGTDTHGSSVALSLASEMATLNLSTNGPSISKSYQSVVNAVPPTGPAAQSPTYGQWAIFSVSTPLSNAFQQDTGAKESVLKVQSTGGG